MVSHGSEDLIPDQEVLHIRIHYDIPHTLTTPVLQCNLSYKLITYVQYYTYANYSTCKLYIDIVQSCSDSETRSYVVLRLLRCLQIVTSRKSVTFIV